MLPREEQDLYRGATTKSKKTFKMKTYFSSCSSPLTSVKYRKLGNDLWYRRLKLFKKRKLKRNFSVLLNASWTEISFTREMMSVILGKIFWKSPSNWCKKSLPLVELLTHSKQRSKASARELFLLLVLSNERDVEGRNEGETEPPEEVLQNWNS